MIIANTHIKGFYYFYIAMLLSRKSHLRNKVKKLQHLIAQLQSS